MAKKQTRRTVSMSARMLAKLTAFATKNRVAVSALTEFWLLQNLKERFDRAAFEKWFMKREAALIGVRREAGIAGAEARAQRHPVMAKRAAEHYQKYGGTIAASARAFGVSRRAVHQQVVKIQGVP